MSSNNNGGYNVSNGLMKFLMGNQGKPAESGGNSNMSGSLFGSQGFGMNQGTLQGLGGMTSMIGDLAGVYAGFQQLKQAKSQFGFQKDYANRNLANQARTQNSGMETRYRATLASMSPSERAGKETLNQYTDRTKVDGSAI